MMNQTCLFAHYNPHAEISDYVFYYLRSLAELSGKVIFISDSPVNEPSRKLLTASLPDCMIVERRNSTPGKGAWGWALKEGLIPESTDRLLLTNDSVLGPITTLEPIFESMAARPELDYWSLTDSFKRGWHVQDYFLCLSKKTFTSAVFKKALLTNNNRSAGAGGSQEEEMSWTKALTEAGFKGAAWLSVRDTLPDSPPVADPSLAPDPTLAQPDRLIRDHGFPFIRKEVLLANPEHFSDIPALFDHIRQQTSYPLPLITTALTDAIRTSPEPRREGPSITVLCHMYYPSSIYYFLKRLAPLRSAKACFIFNLSVSLSHDAYFLEILQQAFPDAVLLQAPNKGRDIGGKLSAIDTLLRRGDQSDYSLIIHDKLSPHAHTGIAWRETLFKVIDEDRLPEVFRIFEKHKDTGVIGASEFIRNDYDPDENSFTVTSRDNLISYIKDYGLRLVNYNFAAGTIFWIRTAILRNFFGQFSPLQIREGLESGNALDFTQGTNIHAWERLFSLLADAQGFKVKGI